MTHFWIKTIIPTCFETASMFTDSIMTEQLALQSYVQILGFHIAIIPQFSKELLLKRLVLAVGVTVHGCF